MRYPGGGFSTTSTNGLRAEDNAYFIEGLFNSEPFSGQGIMNGAGIAGDSATILPIDAIQEFNLQENPPAEYGWKPGAIVNVGLKSGTNTIHGTAFAFGRDGVMDARNLFQRVARGEDGPHAGTVWRQPRRGHHQGQGLFLRSLRRTTLRRRKLLRRHQPIDGVPRIPRCRELHVFGERRLRRQYS